MNAQVTTSHAQDTQKPAQDARKQVAGLSTMLHITHEAQTAENVAEIYFLAVNETYHLVRYDEAVIWVEDVRGKPGVRAISGVPQVDRNAPKIVWLSKLISHIDSRRRPQPDNPDSSAMRPQSLTSDRVPKQIAEDWEEFAGEKVMHIPFTIPKLNRRGGLLFMRDGGWTKNEIRRAISLTETYAHSLAFHNMVPKGRWARFLRKRRTLWITLAVIAAILLFPVKLSVIAPAEIAAKDPWIATSPQEAVVETIHVAPNETVKKGDLLVSLDDTKLRNRANIAEEELKLKQSELRQARQESMSGRNARQSGAQAGLLELEVRQKRNELAYIKELLAKTKIHAETGGIAIFTDPAEWEGRPVRVGEKILTVADEKNINVKIMMPVEDSIRLDKGNIATVFLHSAPLSPIRTKIERISYEAEEMTGEKMAYRIKAQLPEKIMQSGDLPRIGLKGNAKLHGDRVPLVYNLFRKPLGWLSRKLHF